MTLLNGPHDGREIEDSGAVAIHMCITEDGTFSKGIKCGTALYEPSEDRSVAFWSHNAWDGTLEAIIPA